jgi:hypothetical protein
VTAGAWARWREPGSTKREIARALLTGLFASRQRVPIAEAVELAKQLGVSRRTLVRVCPELGIHEVHNGRYGAFWQRPGTETSATQP